MSETKWSPEPWELEHFEDEPKRYALVRARNAVIVAVRHRIDGDEHLANMRRIVAAVNAVQGIPTEALELGRLSLALEHLDSLTQPRSAGEEVQGWEREAARNVLRELGRLK